MSKIKVTLRVRPLNPREVDGGFPVVVAVDNNEAFVTDIRVPECLTKADSRPRYRQFQFDHGFWLEERAGEGAAQSEIYREVGPPLERSILQGYNACLLAYGQSGTGKTHTMLGTRNDPGIIPRLCHNIWDKLQAEEEEVNNADDEGANKSTPKFRMEVSFMEIYREKVRDLLTANGGHLKLREHPQFGPHVQNLSRVEVTQENGLLDLLWEGECRRAIGTTGSNQRSSRSHAIWTIYLTRSRQTKRNAAGCFVEDNESLITNQVHLVDLAGSEKAGFTTAKNLLAEGADINRSLVALGNVISSLAEKTQYIPYRDSALTWLLKDSLGGNATTSIIITASPASCCHAQTLNSFRFAQRARLVENSPRINLNPASTIGLSSNGSTIAGSAALYSVMSAFEIKKDISRLSKIIQSAQNNGGILRGLTPRVSWNRLVNALEGWNHIEGEQLKLQKERDRAASVDTTASASSTSSANAREKASSNVENGSESEDTVIIEKHGSGKGLFGGKTIRKTQAVPSSLPSSSGSSSVTQSPARVVGTEVFIPLSASQKCLTWRQEEIQPPPKLPTPAEVEYSSVGLTPPPTPNSSKNPFPLFLPVQFPVPQHLDHAGRISERVHGAISPFPKGEIIHPMVVPNEALNSPLVTHRIPTLVKPYSLDPSEKATFTSSIHPMAVPCVSDNETFYSLSENEDASIGTPSMLRDMALAKRRAVPVFHGLDEEEEKEPEVEERKSSMKLAYKDAQRKHSSPTLHLPRFPSMFSKSSPRKCVTFEGISEGEFSEDDLQETLQTTTFKTARGNGSTPQMLSDDEQEQDVQSFSSYVQVHTPTWSTCSTDSETESNHSWSFYPEQKDVPVLVKTIPDEVEEKGAHMESVSEWVRDVSSNVQVVPVVVDLKSPMEEEDEMGICDVEEGEYDETSSTVSEPEGTKTKFRTHFEQEYTQMEKIGKQLKQLKQLSQQCQKYNMLQPFLEDLVTLEKSDHTIADPDLDSHIEECSGWNVETELNLVNKELNALNKLLKIKGGPVSSNSPHGKPRRETAESGSGNTRSIHRSPSSGSTPQSQCDSPANAVSFQKGSNPMRRQLSSPGLPRRTSSYPVSRNCYSSNNFIKEPPVQLETDCSSEEVQSSSFSSIPRPSNWYPDSGSFVSSSPGRTALHQYPYPAVSGLGLPNHGPNNGHPPPLSYLDQISSCSSYSGRGSIRTNSSSLSLSHGEPICPSAGGYPCICENEPTSSLHHNHSSGSNGVHYPHQPYGTHHYAPQSSYTHPHPPPMSYNHAPSTTYTNNEYHHSQPGLSNYYTNDLAFQSHAALEQRPRHSTDNFQAYYGRRHF